MEERAQIDVLICGAGAAGLTLAIDLARRGVSFRIVEQMDGPFVGSRGKALQPRTQEVFEDLGIIDRIMAVGGAYPPIRDYRADGGYDEKTMFEAPEPSPDVPYSTPLMLPQFLTEGVMRERLAEFGNHVEFGTTLVDFEQDGEGVSARLTTPHGEERIHARYLIGADGGRSSIRSALGIDFPGKTLGIRAIVADVELSGLDRSAWHQFNDGDMARLVVICPLAGTTLFQVQAPVSPEGDPDISPQGLARMIAERTGRSDIEIRSLSWASVYAMNARLADRYRVGRVFLAGDAAHIHPPSGGQGLNTSVQDSYNLGWKLAAVLAGAPQTLLDTYEEERRPVAAEMLGLSTQLLDRHRARGGMRRGADTDQLDIDYLDSPLSLDGSVRATGPQAGERMPDATLTGAAGQPRRLFDMLTGTSWTLLISSPDYRPLATARTGLRVATVGAAAELRDPANQLGLAPTSPGGRHLLPGPDRRRGDRCHRRRRCRSLRAISARSWPTSSSACGACLPLAKHKRPPRATCPRLSDRPPRNPYESIAPMNVSALPCFALLCAVLVLPATAGGQTRIPADPDPTRVANAPVSPGSEEDWQFQIGAGGFYGPAFLGSKDYQLQVGPMIEVRYKDRFFISVIDGAGFDLIRTDNFRAGPIVKFQQQRQEDGKGNFVIAGKATTALRGLGDVGATFEAGGYLEYQSGGFSAKAEVRKGLNGHEGLIAEVGARYSTGLMGVAVGDRPVIFSVGPRATIVDDKYNGAYFGIDAGQSARSGLAQFNAKGGLQSYGVGATISVPITGNLGAAVMAGYDRLSGDAGKSPLVRERGSRNQATIGLGVIYRFGL